MPEPEAFDRDGYLRRVDARLPFDEPERREILDELAAHLADTAAGLEESGLEPAEAERRAVQRLGPSEALADDLARARRSPRRLLAAAGAGTWAVFAGGMYGLLWGIVLSLAGAVVIGVGVQAIVGVLRLDWHGFDEGWNSALSLVPLGVALYVGGRAVTPAVAARAGYRARTTRWLTAFVGGILVGVYALLGWDGAMTWVTVAALATLPVLWVAGAWRGAALRVPGAGRRIALGLMGVLALGLSSMFLLSTSVGSVLTPVGKPVPGPPDYGFARIGAPVPEAVAAAETGSGADGYAVSGMAGVGEVRAWITFRDPSVLTGWRDLRVEAWRATAPWDVAVVDPSARHPLAIAPASWSAVGGLDGPPGTSLGGALRLDRFPDVQWAYVAITGVAPDGTRHLVVMPDFAQVVFHGTAWGWFTGVLGSR